MGLDGVQVRAEVVPSPMTASINVLELQFVMPIVHVEIKEARNVVQQ